MLPENESSQKRAVAFQPQLLKSVSITENESQKKPQLLQMHSLSITENESAKSRNSTSRPRSMRSMSLSHNHLNQSRRESLSTTKETNLYLKRWWILFLFSGYTATSAFQWINYAVISTVISKFYGVSSTAADWLSLVYMLVYIPLVFPVLWMLDRYGLRVIAITGSSLSALGAIVKTTSNQPHLFPVCMTGSIISAIGQVFIAGMPGIVAATWFGRNEVSTATSVGVLGYQFGIALGFLIPSNFVPTNTDDVKLVAKALNILTISAAVPAIILAFLVWYTFDRKPTLPPCAAQANLVGCEEIKYIEAMKQIFTDRSSFLLFIAFGIIIGGFNSVTTLLNDQILYFFPGHQKDAGNIGLVIVLCGVVGTIVLGTILDKTRAYRMTTLVVYILALISITTFCLTVEYGDLWYLYRVAGGVGFTMNGFLPVGLEYATEITYPINEGLSCGLMTLSAQVVGLCFISVMRSLMTNYSTLAANLVLVCFVAFGVVLVYLTKEDCKRQRANDKGKHKNEQNANSFSEKTEHTNNSEQKEGSTSEKREDNQEEDNQI